MTNKLARFLVIFFVWSVVRGPWSVVRGPWSVVRGPWSVVRGPWSVVRPTRLLDLGFYIRDLERDPKSVLVFSSIKCNIYGNRA
jgi:hypothetical protein